MTANQSERPARTGRSSGPRLAAAFFAALAVGACAGENLFTGPVTTSQKPNVEISAPAPGTTVAANDSVQVTANITASRGITSVQFSGVLDAGGSAFTTVLFTSPSPAADTTLTTYLRRSTPTAGPAKIIVEATDALGDRGADTLAVVLN